MLCISIFTSNLSFPLKCSFLLCQSVFTYLIFKTDVQSFRLETEPLSFFFGIVVSLDFVLLTISLISVCFHYHLNKLWIIYKTTLFFLMLSYNLTTWIIKGTVQFVLVYEITISLLLHCKYH